MSRSDEAKSPLQEMLTDQKESLESALEFWSEVESSMPEEEHWRIMRMCPFYDDLGGMVAPTYMTPSELTEEATSAVQEYLEALDSFSADQLAAFYMGLGFSFLSLPYWGLKSSLLYKAKLEEAMAFYSRLQQELPEDERWTIEKPHFVQSVDLVPPRRVLPTHILEKMLGLVDAQIQTMGIKPF
jgi:hypothetical protein